MGGSSGGPPRLVMASIPPNSCRAMPLPVPGSPPREPLAGQVLDLSLQQQPVVEVFGQPPVTYMPPPATRSAQSLEAVQVFRGPGGVQEIVEVVRDDTEIAQLRTGLEEKAILISEYQRRNIEMQGHCGDYQRRLGDAEGQMSQLRLQKGQLEAELRDRDVKLEEQDAEIQMHIARNAELLGMINDQASRIVALDKLVVDLRSQKEEFEKKNHDLNKHNHELESKIQELENIIKQLQSQKPPHEEKAQQPPQPDNLSDDDLIDHRIKEFFRNHGDYQVSVHKERAGLYFFGKPINKKVSMKVVGSQVLARVGGGWEEVWAWLSQERQAFLEAEGIEEKTEKEGQKRSASFAKTVSEKDGHRRGSHRDQ